MNDLQDNRRILLVDDHRPIHDDFRSILNHAESATENLAQLESSFFGEAVLPSILLPKYELSSAFQGQEALNTVAAAVKEGKPFALGFIDVRMPPGWDGIETIERIWDLDAEMQFVICTAYADYTWEELFKRFGSTDRVVFLRKPFDHTEARQLACTLTSKWNYSILAKARRQELEAMVEARTRELTGTVAKLNEALNNVKTLSGFIPICAGCKKIRDDRGFWNRVEAYITQRTTARFTHGMCPDCAQKYFELTEADLKASQPPGS
jgi:CheY-like chemotaxis protein